MSQTPLHHSSSNTLQTPLVSVVIPLYNNELYVLDAVESVVNQTYANIEIIVVNDGSTDQSLQAIAHLQGSIHIISQTNQGSAIARNKGMAAANGEYIAFLDADDLWTPYKVQLQVDFLSEHKEYQLVCGIDERVDMHFSAQNIEQDNQPPPTLNHQLSGWQFKHLLFSCPYHINNLMLRKSALKDMQFAPHLRRGQDLDFWFQLCSMYQVAYLDVLLSYYRENLSSISYKLQAQNVKLAILQAAVKRHNAEQTRLPFGYKQRAFSSACLEHAYSARVFQKSGKALYAYMQGIYYNPFNRHAYSGSIAAIIEWLGLKSAPVFNTHV